VAREITGTRKVHPQLGRENHSTFEVKCMLIPAKKPRTK